MNDYPSSANDPSTSETLHPGWTRFLRHLEGFSQVLGVAAAVIHHGLRQVTALLYWELSMVVVLSMLALTVATGLRYRWSRARLTFRREHWAAIGLQLAWVIGILIILIFGPFLTALNGWPQTRGELFLVLSEVLLVSRGLVGAISTTRQASSRGGNPALALVLSFVVLIALGTALLMLPRARADGGLPEDNFSEQLKIALFTSTSASCVTGLTIVPTGGENPYWSRTGQTIILCLFQLGGLGMMTCGAFFAAAVGRMNIRESMALREILESETPQGVRRRLLVILAFTLGMECFGAVLLSGLWSDLPLGDQIYYSTFHSVSAFCNAGFSLTEDGFVGLGHRWQVWGGLTTLIIAGGMGFMVFENLFEVLRAGLRSLRPPTLLPLPGRSARLTSGSKLVLITTAALLIGGAVVYYLLESTGPTYHQSWTERIGNAWFQSVTFRTAGFHTVDHGDLQPATKLFAILLMFVGASPGSTGGGIKTVSFALLILALLSILRGQQRVEVLGRTIPPEQVNRALVIIALGVVVLVGATLLVVAFEDQPEFFLNHLYEVASALGTVGVSTGITSTLKWPSQLVLIATMFLGRVGPLTLLLAMTGRTEVVQYAYPEERVALG